MYRCTWGVSIYCREALCNRQLGEERNFCTRWQQSFFQQKWLWTWWNKDWVPTQQVYGHSKIIKQDDMTKDHTTILTSRVEGRMTGEHTIPHKIELVRSSFSVVTVITYKMIFYSFLHEWTILIQTKVYASRQSVLYLAVGHSETWLPFVLQETSQAPRGRLARTAAPFCHLMFTSGIAKAQQLTHGPATARMSLDFVIRAASFYSHSK